MKCIHGALISERTYFRKSSVGWKAPETWRFLVCPKTFPVQILVSNRKKLLQVTRTTYKVLLQCVFFLLLLRSTKIYNLHMCKKMSSNHRIAQCFKGFLFPSCPSFSGKHFQLDTAYSKFFFNHGWNTLFFNSIQNVSHLLHHFVVWWFWVERQWFNSIFCKPSELSPVLFSFRMSLAYDRNLQFQVCSHCMNTCIVTAILLIVHLYNGYSHTVFRPLK